MVVEVHKKVRRLFVWFGTFAAIDWVELDILSSGASVVGYFVHRSIAGEKGFGSHNRQAYARKRNGRSIYQSFKIGTGMHTLIPSTKAQHGRIQLAK